MGYSVDDAFDFVVAGYQKGLDKSDDFVDSITEYGRYFKEAEAGPAEFFSLLQAGLSESTTLGTDKILDVFKEFTIRIGDETSKTKDALAKIGIDDAALRANLDSGKTTLFEVFGEILEKTGDLQSDVAKKNIIADLFGSPGEDIGTELLTAMDLQATKLGDIQGALDKIDFDDFQRQAVSAWRTITQSFADSPIWENMMRDFEPVFKTITDEFPKAVAGIGKDLDFSGLVQSFRDLFESLGRIFGESELASMSKDEINTALQSILDGFAKFVSEAGRVAEFFVGTAEAVWHGLQSLFYHVTEIALEAALAIAKGLSAVTFGDTKVELERTADALEKTLWDIQGKTNDAADKASGGIDKMWNAFRVGAESAGKEVEKVKDGIESIPEEVKTKIDVSATGTDAEEVKKLLSGDPITAEADLEATLRDRKSVV
jgi:phage-related minor tail protein